ncbi:MAG: hypothetical protein H7A53_08130 [Akkermansiaceae bacterium]|nr:hypothetical protein [Akkermansiaceae bacterium]
MEALGAADPVALKSGADIAVVREAADCAAGRGPWLVHQCHLQSLFETIEGILDGTDRSPGTSDLTHEAANPSSAGRPRPREWWAGSPRIWNKNLKTSGSPPTGAIGLVSRHAGPVRPDLLEIPETGGTIS